ncbi:molybdopterin-guanine dinucleotide biosynthesis protein B [Thermovibrio ammonificans]
MVKAISFIGYHNSGKTTLAAQVIKILKEKGYKVAAVKSTKHENVLPEKEGTDTYKLAKAGAEAVALVEPHQSIIRIFKNKEELELQTFLNRHFSNFDVVICEGFKNYSLPKIEVLRKEQKTEPLFKRVENVVAVATDFKVEGITNLPLNSPEEVAEFIESEIIKSEEEPFTVTLSVNGKEVEMKPFIRHMLAELLGGFLKPLKGIEEPVELIEVCVKRREK